LSYSFFSHQGKNRKNLSSEVFLEITNALLKGLIKPGQRIVETKIASQMGISRSPVREAISRLESKGFLVKMPRKGVFVELVDRKKLNDVYLLRNVLERYATKELAKNPKYIYLKKLEYCLKGIREAANKKDVAILAEMDYNFHACICESTKNEELYKTWQNLFARSKMLFAIEGVNIDKIVNNPKEHEEILDAIKNSEVSKAKDLISKHIMEALSYLTYSLFD